MDAILRRTGTVALQLVDGKFADLRILPANRLEALKGSRHGQHSTRHQRPMAYLLHLEHKRRSSG
ncbi:MAG: hypothetical protein PHQ05_10800 [Sterolibacterium sp.]|nr:hypothetical protein [Sterolibacterium sp.]